MSLFIFADSTKILEQLIKLANVHQKVLKYSNPCINLRTAMKTKSNVLKYSTELKFAEQNIEHNQEQIKNVQNSIDLKNVSILVTENYTKELQIIGVRSCISFKRGELKQWTIIVWKPNNQVPDAGLCTVAKMGKNYGNIKKALPCHQDEKDVRLNEALRRSNRICG